MTVGNIPPGEAVEIEIELDGPLTWADGQAMFRFPLVVAPRYMPGRPYGGPDVGGGTASDTTAVPDASRISPPLLLPGYPNPVRLSVDLRVKPAGLRVGPPRVSMPDLCVTPEADGLRIQLKPLADRLDRDLIVRFPLPSQEIQSAFSVQAVDGEHAFALDLVPDDAHQRGPAVPRQVVALLDRSGSMGGWKMACARRAVGRLVDSLVDADAFQVLAFDDQVEPLDPQKPGLRPATDRDRFLAVEQLGAIEERGGTEILAALQAGVAALAGQPDPYLLLITDGQVGNESEVLRWVQQHAKGVRIFTVGIDEAVNAGLLEQLAQVTGGVFTLVESEQALDQAMSGLRARIGRPLVRDLKVELPGVGPDLVGPRELFAGASTRLLGRLAGELPAAVTVTGVAADGSAFRRLVPVHAAAGGSIAKLWARARVLELEHGFLAGWRDAACQPAAITTFALKHGVLCRFTAFVAIDEVRRVQGPAHQVTQAVSSPHGWAQPALDLADERLSDMTLGGAAFAEADDEADAAPMRAEEAPSMLAQQAMPMAKEAKAELPEQRRRQAFGAAPDTPAFLRSAPSLKKSAAPRGCGGAPPPPPAPAPAIAPGSPPASVAASQAASKPVPPAEPLDPVQLALEALRRSTTPAELAAAFQALVEAVARATGQDAAAVWARLDGAWQAHQAGSASREAFLAEVEVQVQGLLAQAPARRDGFWL